MMTYKGQEHEWSPEAFAKLVPLTPDAYRADNEDELNSMRTAAGIEPKKIHEPSEDVKALQSAAGIR